MFLKGLSDQYQNRPLVTRAHVPRQVALDSGEGTAYDGKMTDIWACGCILFTLVAGQYPFGDEVKEKPAVVRWVRSHCRFRIRGTESLSKSGIKWVNCRTKRQCDRTLGVPPHRQLPVPAAGVDLPRVRGLAQPHLGARRRC
jgi:serine/threonine protein kinase